MKEEATFAIVMSPSKRNDVTKAAINGPHSLRTINKDSHEILKPSSLTTPNAAASSQSLSSKQLPDSTAKRPPVIIYTHSPKIIHAQARDFMALVQKLTGFTRSGQLDDKPSSENKPDQEKVEFDGGNVDYKNVEFEDTKPSTLMEFDKRRPEIFPANGVQTNQYLSAAVAADVPFFASSSHLFYEPPGFGNPISPPFMDFTNGFGEY